MSKTSDDALNQMLDSVVVEETGKRKEPEVSILDMLDGEAEPEEHGDEPEEKGGVEDLRSGEESEGDGEEEEEGAETPEEIEAEGGEAGGEGETEEDESDDSDDPLVLENARLREALQEAMQGFPLDDLELPEETAAKGKAGKTLEDSNPYLDQLESHIKVDSDRYEEILSSPEKFYEFMKTAMAFNRNSTLVSLPSIFSHWQQSEGALHQFFTSAQNKDVAAVAPYVRAVADRIQELRPTMAANEILEEAAKYVRKKLKIAQAQSGETQTRLRGKVKPADETKKVPRFAGTNKRRRTNSASPASKPPATKEQELLNQMFERNR